MNAPFRERPTATPTVLIVDGDQGFVSRLRQKIKDAGYRPVWARDGREALDAMMHERPDLILIDGALPAGEASELMSKVNRSPALSRIPRVVLTAQDCAALDAPASSRRAGFGRVAEVIRRLVPSAGAVAIRAIPAIGRPIG